MAAYGNPFYVDPSNDISQGLTGLSSVLGRYGQYRDKQDAIAEQKQQEQEMKAAVQEAWQSKDPLKMAEVSIMYPGAAKSMETAFGFTNEQSKQGAINTYRQLLAETDPQRRLDIMDAGIQRVAEMGGKPMNMINDRVFLQNNPEGAMQAIKGAYAFMDPQGYKAMYPKEGSGGGYGVYNPRDYTTDSWAEFVKTDDPGVLERYANAQSVDIGGVPHVFDPARQGYFPASVTGAQGASGGQPTPITAESVAETKGTIARGQRAGELEAETGSAGGAAFETQIGKDAAAVYSKLQTAAQEASAFIPRLESLRTLAQGINTGTGAEIKLAAKKLFGIDSSDMEVLNAALGELAQDILNQQTGTKTDFDFQNAVRQSASLGKTKEANVMLINALIERQQQAVNFADQAQQAYQNSGPKGVLDMRYNAPANTSGPSIGTVEDGYRFKGGNPQDPNNWEPAQ